MQRYVGQPPYQWQGDINQSSRQAVGLTALFHPLMHWRDLIGGYQMTPVGNAAANGIDAQLGRTYSLDGTDDCAYVTLPDAWKLQRFTVAAWVVCASGGGGTVFSLVPRGAASDGRGMFVAAYPAYTYLVIGAGAGSYTYSNTGQALTAGVPHLITQTYDGANMIVYVNGRQDSTKAAAITIQYANKAGSYGPNPESSYIGAYHNTTNTSPATTADILYEFNGWVGPVSLYNRALSAAEIWALYDPATRWELYQPPRPMVWRTYVGTEYTKSVIANVIPLTYDDPISEPVTQWPTKRTMRTLAASLTPTGALSMLKAFFRVVSGRMQPSSSMARRTTRTLAAGLTPTGALSQLKAFLRTLIANVAPVTYNDPMAEPVTQWPTKRTMRTLAASLTPTGALSHLKAYLRTLAASLTPTGNLVRGVAHTLTAGLTPTGALSVIKALLRTLTAFMAPVTYDDPILTPVTLWPTKRTMRTLAAGLTPSGVLIPLKAFLRTLAASLTPSANVVKGTAHRLAAGLTPSANVVRGMASTVTASLTPAANVVKRTARTLAASLTPTGALSAVRAYLLILTASLTPSGGLVRGIARTLTASLMPLASLLRLLSGVTGGRAKCTLTMQAATTAQLAMQNATTCGLELSEV